MIFLFVLVCVYLFRLMRLLLHISICPLVFIIISPIVLQGGYGARLYSYLSYVSYCAVFPTFYVTRCVNRHISTMIRLQSVIRSVQLEQSTHRRRDRIARTFRCRVDGYLRVDARVRGLVAALA